MVAHKKVESFQAFTLSKVYSLGEFTRWLYMSPQETSGMSFTSLFIFSAIPYRSGNNCPLVNVS